MSLNIHVSRDFAHDYRSWNAGLGLVFLPAALGTLLFVCTLP
jgi:hypothetical protein